MTLAPAAFEPQAFLAALLSRGIKLSIDAGQLVLNAPRGALTPTLRDEIAEHKPALLAALSRRSERPELKPVDRSLPLPLSFAQQRLWFLQQLDPSSRQYNIPATFRLQGELDVAALERALTEILRRHESLRTRFFLGADGPRQEVTATPELTLTVDTITDPEELARLATSEAEQPFDLSQAPMLRARLVRMSALDHYLIVVVHHIAADAWSSGVLAHELVALYQAYRAGQSSPLAPLAIQYADYAEWQRACLSDAVVESQSQYWRERLCGAPDLLTLPTDRPRPDVPSDRGASTATTLAEPLAHSLEQLARRAGVTPFVLFVTAYQVLLRRLSGQDDVVVGFPIAGRNQPALERMVGFFVNALPLRSDFADDPAFLDAVGRAREHVLNAFAHQDLPFEKMVEALQVPRSSSHAPIFQAMFAFQNAPKVNAAIEGLTFEEVPLAPQTAKFDLTLSIEPREGTYRIELEYATALFDRETAERWLGHFETLLESIVRAPEQSVTRLPIMTSGERKQLLKWWPEVPVVPVSVDTIVDRWNEQVLRTPGREALTCGERRLSYAEVDARANAMAHELIGRGIGPGENVGLCLDRSWEMVVTILAVFKAGGAYVPLDPELPRERLEFILTDAAPRLVVAETRLTTNLGLAIPLVDIDSFAALKDVAPAATSPERRAGPADLAYVIYTSGSTGKPKGVQVTHQNVVRLMDNTVATFHFGASDVWTLFHSYAFDFSVWELWGAFFYGGRLVVVPHVLARDPQSFYELVCRERVTVLNQTPSAFYPFLRSAVGSERSHGLKWIILSGEALDIYQLTPWYEKFGQATTLVNGYGITETTVFVTFQVLQPKNLKGPSRSPIGTPIADMPTYILDQHLEPVPLGVFGELCVGGPGVTLGYLGRPELTASRFVKNPHGEGMLYRSGDLARVLRDGTLEYLGRADGQVKIRGFRIELGEIEAALHRHPDVAEAVVKVWEDEARGKYLVAYTVARSPSALPSAATLREHLRRDLPEPMVPAEYVALTAMPLNNNGKADRKALTRPTATVAAQTSDMKLTATEHVIASVLAELLGRAAVGPDENFFDLGAHSLLLVEAHRRIRDRVGREFALVEIFQYPTTRTLAVHLDAKQTAPEPAGSVEQQGAPGDEPIAVIGMACRFPRARSAAEFWQRIADGEQLIRFFSDDELAAAGVPRATLENPRYVKAAAHLEDADRFDARFFGYTPREAELLDPQQRVFLECAWEALEHAGTAPGRERSIGVFAGSAINRYLLFNLAQNPDAVEAAGQFATMLANDKDFLATRTSYKLDLRGPSITVQTACSTSLVAIHMARQSILSGECDIALAGGIALDVKPRGYLYQEGGIGSPDGHCRAFDEAAQGTVGGSGVGIVVLKRLSQAVADGDEIHAVIRGSAVNNDGADKVGYTAPSVNGQVAVIRQALAAARVAPDSIGLVEAHGTGTSLGDPIEVEALTQAYRTQPDRRQSCALGSVKTNVGHLDAAAGVAGFIKAVMALKHQALPPSLNYQRPNPRIAFENSPFYVNTELKPWPASEPRRAAVSAFGVGGTNAHVILEEAPKRPTPQDVGPAELLVVSAKSEADLQAMTARLDAHLGEHPELRPADVAFTLQSGRRKFEHRAARIVRAPSHGDTPAAGRWLSGHCDARRQTVFAFPGLGSLLGGLGAELFETEPAFRDSLLRSSAVLQPMLGVDLRELIFNGDARLARPSFMQPALLALELAYAALWQAHGVEPKAVIGHSFGEFAAAVVAGACSAEDALALVATRGRLFDDAPRGVLLAVATSPATLTDLLGDDCWLAAVNGPELCLASATPTAVIALERRLSEKRIAHRRLDVDHVTHCPLAQPLAKPLYEAARLVTWRAPRLPMTSSMTGEWISLADADAADFWPDYWAQQLVRPVAFDQAASTLLNGKSTLVIELGGGRSVASMLRRHPAMGPGGLVIASAPSVSEQRNAFLEALGTAWVNGQDVTWPRAERATSKVALPHYPFQSERFWIEPQRERSASSQQRLAEDAWYSVPSWRRLPLSSSRSEPIEGPWLVFTDDGGRADHLIASLRDQGADVVTVPRPSSASAGSVDIATQAAKLFDELFTSLKQQGRLPRAIIYAWPLDLDATTADWSFYVPMQLAKANGRAQMGSDVRFWFVTSQTSRVLGDEVIVPEKATLLGLAKVMGNEYPGVRSTCLDLDATASVTSAMLRDAWLEHPLIAWRGKAAWRPCFECVAPPNKPEIRLRHGGVYVIFGGSGGIGRALTKHLESVYSARVIGISRNAAAPDRRADLGCRDDVVRVLRAALGTHGRIDGIIHAAGLPGGGMIQHRDVEAVARVLRAKVEGGRHLENALDELAIAPDFVLLCSSLNAFLGGVGQADYAAANAFLDALAHASRHRVITVNWGAWKEAGMAVDLGLDLPEALRQHRRHIVETGLSQRDGAKAFETALAMGEPQLVVSPLALSALEEAARAMTIANALTGGVAKASSPITLHRRSLATPSVAPRDEIEHRIADVWQQHLGIADIGVHDNFFELGGHSLLAVGMKASLESALGRELPIAALFQGTTIAELATYLRAEGARPSPALVKLKDGAAKAPFFCVHAVSGTAFPLVELAKNFSVDCPVYGLQSPSLSTGEPPHQTVDAMATAYVEAIRQIQPTGPYRLGGWSFGGTVAFEMARRLVAAGESVETLVLLDMASPEEASSLAALAPAGSIRAQFEADIAGMFGRERPGAAEIERLARVFEANLIAQACYRPQPYPGSLHLLRAQDGLFALAASEDLGWSRLATIVTTLIVPGDHYSILQPPHVTVLARELSILLADNDTPVSTRNEDHD